MSSRQRLVNLAIAAVIAIVAVVLIVATGGDDSDAEREATAQTPTPTQTTAPGKTPEVSTATPEPTEAPIPAIEIRDGEVVGGVADLRFKEGDRVQFSVTADVADEVHVHAYDFMKDVEPGKAVEFDFPATITGITEIELEDAGLQIAELRVDP